MLKKADALCLRRLGLIYGVIIAFINFLGYLVATSLEVPLKDDVNISAWISFLNENSYLSSFFGMASFLVPTVVCIAYTIFCKENNVISRIVNLPIIYSLLGALGWLFTLIAETIVLLYLQVRGVLNMKNIFISNFLNLFLICIFIVTFSFLILDIIHRRIVLVRLFPEGRLSRNTGVIKLSTGILILIFYFSIGIFPTVFLCMALYNLSQLYGFAINLGIILVVTLILVFGMIMTFFFSDHFSGPLKKLVEATQSVIDSNYDVKVDVVSSDDFGSLADSYNEMASSLNEKSIKILAIQDSIIRGMAVMVEQRDNSTGGHINRTSDCVKVFMKYLQNNEKYTFSESFCSSVIKAAPMHDLGKIAVDDVVLRKPGRFTDEEYEIMKKHAAAGAIIVDQVLSEVDDEEFKKVTRNVAHYHHEKWNGTGYPEGLSGENIPIEARIMALADVFDALVSKRCYKDSLSYEKAFEIIRDSLGTHFDPELGELFLQCETELIHLYASYNNE